MILNYKFNALMVKDPLDVERRHRVTVAHDGLVGLSVLLYSSSALSVLLISIH